MEAHVVFAPDGALITSAVLGETLAWDARSGRIARRYAIAGQPALSPDGHTLALGLNNGQFGDPATAIALLDLRTGRHRRLLEELPNEWVLSLQFTRDGKRIAAPAFNGTRIWDVESGKIVESYREGERLDGSGSDVAIDRRGLVIFTTGDGTITAWDPEGARRVAPVFAYGSHGPGCLGYLCAATDPGSAVMPTILADGRVALLDLRTKRPTHVFPARDGLPAEAIAFVRGGRRFATGGTAGTVTVRDVASRQEVGRLRFPDPVWAIAVSPDGALIAALQQADGANDARVEVRDVSSGTTLYTRTIGFGPGGIGFTGDGSTLIASGCCDSGVDADRVERPLGGTTIRTGRRAGGPGFRGVAGRPDGRRRSR